MKRKEAILEEARELFNNSNTQSITTNHIAKAMSISPGNLHYHYKNREEIIFKLYTNLRSELSLDIKELPKTIEELHEHEKVLIQIQWKYRFFFRELLFLFSRDNNLQEQYIKDNLAHRSRIKIVMQNLCNNNELNIPDNQALDHVVDSILMSWQFYTSYMFTLGKVLTSKDIDQVISYTTNVMKLYIK